MAKPEQESAKSAQRNCAGEKLAGFRQSDKTHNNQTENNDEADGMSGPNASAVSAERDDLNGARADVVGPVLHAVAMLKGHGCLPLEYGIRV